MVDSDKFVSRAIRENALELEHSGQDYVTLLDLIGDSRLVLIGEATHGTHEFYRTRAELTSRLIEEKGFTAVAAEADCPDAYRVNRFAKGQSSDASAIQALDSFRRFPSWMWRNTEVLEFVSWLRRYNDLLPAQAQKAGFYGLDLYSFHASARAVLDYLDKVDPEAAQRARDRYGCFERFGEDVQAYGYAASFGMSESCEDEVVSQLVEMTRRATELASRGGEAGNCPRRYASFRRARSAGACRRIGQGLVSHVPGTRWRKRERGVEGLSLGDEVLERWSRQKMQRSFVLLRMTRAPG
jgi:erythromycin esterase-like protein